MEIRNKIERFEIEIKKIQKSRLINRLLVENKSIYEHLILDKENEPINAAYASSGIFFQYKLTEKHDYLKNFIFDTLDIINEKKKIYIEKHYYQFLNFMVNFIHLCFLITNDKSYLDKIRCIYVELLFMKNNHNIVHEK